MGFDDVQIMGMKEILADAIVNATRGRVNAIQDIVQDVEFSTEHGINDRLASIDEDATGDLFDRADAFVNARVDAGEDVLYEPVEISRVIMQLSHLTYILNDEFSLSTARGAITLWEMLLQEGGLPEGYPQEGADLVTELMKNAQEYLDKVTDPVKMVILWNERFDQQHAPSYGGIEELLAQLRGMADVSEGEVEEQA